MENLAIIEEVPDLSAVHAKASTPTGRILVAEDDLHMRRLIAHALRSCGYRVVEAADGAEVLTRIESTIWRDRHDVIRAIVADMNMPALGGLDVLAALRCAEVDTPFILITAYGDTRIRREAAALGAAAVLDKPFALAQLQHALRDALSGSERAPRDPRKPRLH